MLAGSASPPRVRRSLQEPRLPISRQLVRGRSRRRTASLPPPPGGAIGSPALPYWRSLFAQRAERDPQDARGMGAIAKSMAEGLGKIRCRSTTATVRPPVRSCRRRHGDKRCGRRLTGIASGPISSPAASNAPRWMQLSSSRTSPCHACAQVSEGRLLGGRTGRALALAYFGGTISTERRDVGGPLAPRRQVEVDHLQAKQQILAKAASDYLRSQVAVAGGDQPQVELDGRGPPTRSISRSWRARAAAWPGADATQGRRPTHWRGLIRLGAGGPGSRRRYPG